MQRLYNGINNIREVIEGSNRVLLVCDASFPFLSIKDSIENMEIPHVSFCDFTQNPQYEDVCKGVEVFQESKCDTILAVGGGSSIDVAKCIKLFCRMEKGQVYLNQEYKDSGIKLVAVPTTAGTGSESTRYAVIYYNGEKQSVTHDSIIPDYVILEPDVLKTLPLYQKKCTLLDALCQGVESWWSVNSNDNSKQLSKQAIKTIMRWWHDYIFKNSSEAARQIMIAANYAGQAINITQTTAAHAFSYKLTSLYKVPHGHSVALCFPVIWTYMINHIDKCLDIRGEEYLKKVFVDISYAMGCKTPEEAVLVFNQMMSEMEMPKPVPVNLDDELGILVHSVNPVRLKNNPVELDEQTIMSIYKEVLNN